MARWSERIDTTVAVLMATAAVMTAWATYQASQWDSVAAAERSDSAILRSDAARAAADAVTESEIDAAIWIDWEKSVALDRAELAVFLRDRFSPELESAHEDWLGRRVLLDGDGIPVSGRLPLGTPLGLDTYTPPAALEADGFAAAADARLADADAASDISGGYVLQAVLLALVLFFGSAAAKFNTIRLQAAMATSAAAMLTLTVWRIAQLPRS